jgi:hypothetical protein
MSRGHDHDRDTHDLVDQIKRIRHEPQTPDRQTPRVPKRRPATLDCQKPGWNGRPRTMAVVVFAALPYGPYLDSFSLEQHKYGPFEPIRAALARLKPN